MDALNKGRSHVECPVCGLRVREITVQHARMHGYSSVAEFRTAHPGVSLVSSGRRRKSASACLRQWEDGVHAGNAEAARKHATRLWGDPESAERIRERMSEAWRSMPKHKLRRRSSVIREYWASERGTACKARMRELALCRHSEKAGFSWTPKYQYNGVGMRSYFEIAFALFMDMEGVAFRYEPFRLRVGSTRRFYTPDFVVGDVVVEVKTSQYRRNIDYSRQASQANGYTFVTCGLDDALAGWYSFLYSSWFRGSVVFSYESFKEKYSHGQGTSGSSRWRSAVLRHRERLRAELLPHFGRAPKS